MEKKVVNPLFFENSQGKERVIAEVDNIAEAFEEIHKFCAEHNYTVYYTRHWVEDCPVEDGSNEVVAYRITFDVGSWSEFFHIYFDTQKQAENFLISNIEKPF